MDEEFIKRLADYFTSEELVDLLNIPTIELIPLIEDYILERKEEIDEYLSYGTR